MTAFRDQSLDAILSPELRRSGYHSRAAYRARFLAHSALPPLQQLQAVDLETYLPGDILVKADRATMAYSLEGRAPWLDYRIAELAARLPAGWKIQGRSGKHIFKKMLEPLVFDEILYRPKMGFSVPLAEWFRTSLKPVYEAGVLAPESAQWIDLAEARRLFDEHGSGFHDHSRKLWNLLMLAEWRRQYAG